jgi:hypothetical protein
VALCPLDAWDMGLNPQVLGIGGTIAIKSNKKKIEMDSKTYNKNEISIILRMKNHNPMENFYFIFILSFKPFPYHRPESCPAIQNGWFCG